MNMIKLIFILLSIIIFLLPLNTYANISVDATSLFKEFQNELKDMESSCKDTLFDQITVTFGGVVHSMKSGWGMIIGKKNNQCELARQSYLLRQQIYLLRKLKNFCKKIGGGIPDYENLLNIDFLKTIGFDGNGVPSFLPSNINEHEEYNELTNFIFQLRFNFNGAKNDSRNYVRYLSMLIRFYERRKADNPIPTMPEKIEDEEKEKQACDNPNRKDLIPNSKFSSAIDNAISTSNPFINQSPVYKGNFYQLPVFTMIPKDSARKDWQLCSCAFIGDLSSNTSFGKDNNSGFSGLESFIKDVNNVIETISSPSKIMEYLQLGWEHLKKLLYTSISGNTEKKEAPTLKDISEKFTSRLQKSWNDNVAKQINDLKNTITSTYEKEGAFGVLGKFVNVKMSINARVNLNMSNFTYSKDITLSDLLKKNKQLRKVNEFQKNIESDISNDINENVNTLKEENFFAKTFNFIQANIRYYLSDIKKALFTANKVDGYMSDSNNLPNNYSEYKEITYYDNTNLTNDIYKSSPRKPINGQCGLAHNNNFFSEPLKDLCNTGIPTRVSTSGQKFIWKCIGLYGGSDSDCMANKTNLFIVKVISTGGGSASPTQINVKAGDTTIINISPNPGYIIDKISGCNGTLSGNKYTTGQISSNCDINVSFKKNLNTPFLPKCGLANGKTFDTVPQEDTLCEIGESTFIEAGDTKYIDIGVIRGGKSTHFIRDITNKKWKWKCYNNNQYTECSANIRNPITYREAISPGWSPFYYLNNINVLLFDKPPNYGRSAKFFTFSLKDKNNANCSKMLDFEVSRDVAIPCNENAVISSIDLGSEEAWWQYYWKYFAANGKSPICNNNSPSFQQSFCLIYNEEIFVPGPASFKEIEFVIGNYKINDLVNALKNDGIISVPQGTIIDINYLNNLLDDNLYKKLIDKMKYSSDILVKHRIFYEKNPTKENLRILNRAALEDFYPDKTPKSEKMGMYFYNDGGKMSIFYPRHTYYYVMVVGDDGHCEMNNTFFNELVFRVAWDCK